MTNEEILKEIVREREIEKEGAEMMGNIYSKKTEGQILNQEKLLLKKRLVEIEEKENPPIPYLEEIKKELLRKKVARFMKEQKTRNEMLKTITNQNTSVNLKGEIIYGQGG